MFNHADLLCFFLDVFSGVAFDWILPAGLLICFVPVEQRHSNKNTSLLLLIPVHPVGILWDPDICFMSIFTFAEDH